MKFISKLPEQLRSLARFPVPVAACIGLTIFFNLQVAGFFRVSSKTESDLIFAAVGAVVAGLAASLWCGTRRLSAATGVLIPLAAAGLAALLLFSQGRIYPQANVALVGLALATMVAAHLRRAASIDSFWGFNLQLGIAIAMGFVATVVLCGGLSLLILSVEYLFDVEIDDTIYSHIWTTGAMLIAPLCTLAMIPAEVDEPFVANANPGLMEQSVFYVLNFALAPLVLAYSLMLHAYAVKLAITMTMPKYETEWMVLTFGAVGTVTYMVAYPWRELGGYALVRWFMRSWFWLMIVPTVMLTLAVWHLTAEYGVTTGRYCLCLFAIWLAAMVLYLGMARGRIELRAIPASLSVALILASFGPWGATAVSRRSQLRQFHELLEQRRLLVDGRLKLDPPRLLTFARIVASSDRLRINLDWLDRLDVLDRISPVFASIADDPFQRHLGDEPLRVLLGMRGREFLEDTSKQDIADSQPPHGIETENLIRLKFNTGRYNQLVGPLWMNRAGKISRDQSGQEYPPQIKGLAVAYNDPVLTACWGPGVSNYNYGGIIDVCSGSEVVNFNLAGEMKPDKPFANLPVLIPAHEGGNRASLILVRPSEIRSNNLNKMFEVWILLDRAEASTPADSDKRDD